MKPEETKEWWKVFTALFGAGLLMLTLATLAGHGSAEVALGMWVWPAVMMIILLFRKTYLAGKRKGSRDD